MKLRVFDGVSQIFFCFDSGFAKAWTLQLWKHMNIYDQCIDMPEYYDSLLPDSSGKCIKKRDFQF